MTTRVSDVVGGAGEEGKVVRRFAPLGGEGKGEEGVRKLRGIIFDMDGTLCEPQTYMFGQMRGALGIDKSIDILDHIYSLPVSDQEAAHEKIRAIEREAMLTQVPQPGLQTLFTFLSTLTPTLPLAILTRNHPPPVHHLLTTHLPQIPFSPIITREFRPPKPHPAGILHIAKEWNVDPRDTIMVGDSIDDMKAGFSAGAATVLLGNSVNEELWEHECTDLVVKRLDELVEVLKEGFVGSVER
ncbi:putative had superfamily protein [Botrytis cinerea BcDW1]|nr:putative had superfamily protein [Botrytis cinerea BcDW1]CCD45053.1 similar to HAD superfamily hydrolase [Botrytis cinerea T4]